MCWPSMSETLMYTGYKKCHGMKFQGIAVPNGMITYLAGPYCTPQNDAGFLAESHLLELMHEHTIQPGLVEGDPLEHHHFQLYSDSAYRVSAVLMSPHAWVKVLTMVEHAWNTGMGEVCISVKYVFGMACGLWYCTVVLLANTHNCFVPNQTALGKGTGMGNTGGFCFGVQGVWVWC